MKQYFMVLALFMLRSWAVREPRIRPGHGQRERRLQRRGR